MQLARGDEGEEVGRGLGMVVAPAKQPVFASSCDGPQGPLRPDIVEFKSRVVEKPAKRSFLAQRVALRLGYESARSFLLHFLAHPIEEGVDQRKYLLEPSR